MRSRIRSNVHTTRLESTRQISKASGLYLKLAKFQFFAQTWSNARELNHRMPPVPFDWKLTKKHSDSRANTKKWCLRKKQLTADFISRLHEMRTPNKRTSIESTQAYCNICRACIALSRKRERERSRWRSQYFYPSSAGDG